MNLAKGFHFCFLRIEYWKLQLHNALRKIPIKPVTICIKRSSLDILVAVEASTSEENGQDFYLVVDCGIHCLFPGIWMRRCIDVRTCPVFLSTTFSKSKFDYKLRNNVPVSSNLGFTEWSNQNCNFKTYQCRRNWSLGRILPRYETTMEGSHHVSEKGQQIPISRPIGNSYQLKNQRRQCVH